MSDIIAFDSEESHMRLYEFEVHFSPEKADAIHFNNTPVIHFVSLYPVLQNLHHFIKDFATTFFKMINHLGLLHNDTNR